MKNVKLLIITFVFLAFNIAKADNLQAKAAFTESSARIEAFKDVARKVPKQMFKNYIKDKYYKENYSSLKNKIFQISNEPKRNINPFYTMNNIVLYSVEYEDDINKKYYYNAFGRLAKFEINDYDGKYPYRAIAYNKKGEVVNVTFVVSEIESFIFNKNEKLVGYWYDNQFYNEKGIQNINRILE